MAESPFDIDILAEGQPCLARIPLAGRRVHRLRTYMNVCLVSKVDSKLDIVGYWIMRVANVQL
jgi:hypothetical protein